jgi:hypothetical protein
MYINGIVFVSIPMLNRQASVFRFRERKNTYRTELMVPAL